MVGSSAIARWATFDCYGTLIDWNAGIGRELERLFGAQPPPKLLHAYHEVEPQVQREDPRRSYREVLGLTLARLADREGFRLSPQEHEALARSLPDWPPFPEARSALEEARARGWRLAILSNTDRDLIEASMQRLGVQFEFSIVAGELGSYKPSPLHWEAFRARCEAERKRHVHVGASLYHDIAPAVALGIPTVWINRLGEAAQPQPTVELRDLAGLADTLDRLVAA
ncbi:MAG: HAD-IA family hydrolase [Pseudonocardiaceae bacterium]